MKLQAVRGFKDWLPEEFVKYNFLIEKAKTQLYAYNFKEIKIPILEKTELFIRSIGEFTDIVQKETYTFQDRNKEFLTLRPEATAGICRMVLEKGLYLRPRPLKFFTIGPMFRHERPQKGRLREFYQIDVEIFSELNPYLEGEIILLSLEILEKPLKDLKINKAEVYTLELNTLGCPKCRAIYKEVLVSFLNQKKENFCETCRERIERNPLRVLDCKNEVCKAIVFQGPVILDYLCEECKLHFEKLKEILQDIGISFVINPYLVRGLDYYVRTIFEIKAKGLGAQDTVCAGGRYDYLLKELGGPELPAIGFAIGLERWALSVFGEEDMLSSSKTLLEDLEPDLYLALLGQRAIKEGFVLARNLRKKGIKCEVTYEDKSLKAHLKTADKLKAKYAVILGEEEFKENKAILRNLKESKQVEIGFKNLEELAENIIKAIDLS